MAACAVPLPAETVPLDVATGRIAAEDARSAVDLPPFDRSAMDGFAVRAADTSPPRALTIAGELAAGDVAADALAPGTALGITTGAALPAGADAVLRVEDASVDGDRVTPAGPVGAGTHVRYRGEDVARGRVLAPAGAELGVQHVTALASAGVGAVAVHRRPVVHVIATGTELLEVGAPPEPGRIHESNRLTLRLLAERVGAEVVVHPVVPDDAAATAAAVEAALSGDVLAISGGVSVGPHDHVKPALQERGVEEVFWRVRLKPGKPMWFGRRGPTLVFGLPGNPLSTVACFLLFVDPALRRMQGEAERGAALRARPPDRPRAPRGRPHDAAHRPHRARHRRRARGDADGGPGFAPDGRAGRQRRLRGGPARGRRARRGRERGRVAALTAAAPR